MRKTSFLAAAAMLAAAAPATAKFAPGIVTGQASGGSDIAVYNRLLLPAVQKRSPYPGFGGGVYVGAGDVNGDGVADIVTGAGAGGGPHVKVFDGATHAEIRSFFAYDPAFGGGVHVAAGDVDGDGFADIVTGAGPGGGPHVKVFSGRSGDLLHSFFAFDVGFTGGVAVAAGDSNGDGFADIITGAGPGGGPNVKVFDSTNGDLLASFFAFDPGFTGGVSLATGRYLGADALFVGAGPGGAPEVRIFSLSDFSLLNSFLAFDADFTGGVNVGAGRFGGFDLVYAAAASRVSKIDAFTIKQTVAGRGVAIERLFELTPFGPDDTGGLFVAGVPGTVPEPAVWLQLICGFGIAGATLRGRRRATA